MMDVIEDSYELSPTQLGMLFHSLDAGSSGVDIEQIVGSLHEDLDVSILMAAWQRVTQRHPILRTSFRWEGLPQPRQEVRRSVALAIEQLDWRGLPEAEREHELASLLRAERSRGFDLRQAPLMRLTLARMGSSTYQLVWTFHHILLDGRSFPLVLREVFDQYEALRLGQDVEAQEPRPYRDFITWLNTLDLNQKAAEIYWRRTLAGFTAPTPLVVARDPGSDTRSAGAQAGDEIRLSEAATAALKAFAREHDVTLNTLLQGAWAMLLHRYSGEADVVFGATRAGRRSTVPGADAMVGLFINTVPLRVPVTPEARLLPWLRELRAQNVAVRAYEHTPLVKIQGWADVPRGQPLFESIIVFENRSLDAELRALGGSWTNRHFRYQGQTNYPLTVIAYADAALLVRIEYDRRRFDSATVARMLEHLRTLLEAVVGDPERRLWQLPLVTEAERQQLLVEWNPATAPSAAAGSGSGGACLHRGFAAQARRTPGAVAVTWQGQQLTYAELDRRANQLGHRLRARGVGPDVLVGLCAERSADLVIGILGILKAGGAYVPLDPAYPHARLAFMLEDAHVAVLVTQRELVDRLPAGAAPVVCLDDDGASWPQPDEADEAPADGATADNLAYVIYTSGSTGQPKGVPVTHRNVARLFEATDGWFGFDEHDVWTLFHSYAFDFSVWELWGPLLRGGRLVVVPYWVSRSPEAFGELLGREAVTVLNQTPSAFRQLVQADLAAAAPLGPALRLVIFGGEALELASLLPWLERHGDSRPRLVNMYGITETTVHVTYRPITLADVRGGAGSVIGRPIPDLRVHVLDPHQQLVPIGVPGELYVGGAGLARGYLNRPELTAERFVPDPFAGGDAGRLYRTGDLARRLPNGELEYLGRLDHQVKIRGFRIELGEIETALGQHSAVREAVVLTREDAAGSKRLVAYLATDQDRQAVIEEVTALLRGKLPDYMVPASFVVLDALPLTENGKVDRKALPSVDVPAAERHRPYVAPTNPVEETLARIWSAVLRVEHVGIHDNFFELGGDSILSIQVVARCRQAGLSLTPWELFKHPEIAELATVQPAGAAALSDQGLSSGSVPLTPIQRWFFEQELAEPHHWNQAFLFQVAADLDLPLLEAALHHVVRHHDALRLRFTRGSQGWQQSYADDADDADDRGGVSIRRVDLTTMPPAEQAAALARVAADVQASLDLAAGPLLRAAHVALGGDQPSRLLLVVHHLVVDGVSWRVLVEDVESAYRGLVNGEPVRLPAKTTSFQTWSERLTEYARSIPSHDRDYWLGTLEATVARLPVDHEPRDASREASARTVTVSLSAEETRALLHQVPAVYHTQINDALLTALALAFKEWTGQESLLIDLEGHGREPIVADVDVSRTVGWFTSLFPVRLDIGAASDPGAAVKAVKEQLRHIPDRGLSYGALRYLDDDADVAARLSSGPRADVLFNYLGQFDQVVAGSSLFRFAQESSGPWHSPRARRRYLLDVLALVVDGRLQVGWTYSEDVHRCETIARLADGFLHAIRELVKHCLAPGAGGYTPSDFPLAGLDQATLDRLQHQYLGLEDVYPLSPMQQLFYSMEAAQSRLGFEQWHFTLLGPLDPAALRRAWQQVLARHSVLRTAFASEGLREPVQAVLRQVPLPWFEHDWRGLAHAEQEARLAAFVSDDRDSPFDLARPPLTRVSLIRVADDTYHLVWSTHHLHIDGWSWPLVFRDLSAIYDAERQGHHAHLGAAPPYRDYVEWLQRQPVSESEAFWRDALDGYLAPTPLDIGDPARSSPSSSEPSAEESLRLPAGTTAEMQRWAREHHVTLSTLIQGAWAMLLSHYSGDEDVVFGAAFAGRPAELAGIEAMVGPCVNNLPVRLQVRAEDGLVPWLTHLQEQHFEIGRHQYASPQQIQQWSDVPWRLRLFDSLVVFQNYAVDDAVDRLGPAVAVQPVSAPEGTNYPLTLTVTPGPELLMKIIYHPQRLDRDAIRVMLGDMRTVLEAMAASSTRPLSALLSRLAPASKGEAARARARGLASRRPDVGAAPLAPRTDLERTITAIWQELFQVDGIGIDENFFDLGGHSLLLLQAHGKLQASVDAELPIVALFQYPTISSLARYLSHEQDRQPTYQDVRDRAKQQIEALGKQKRLIQKSRRVQF